MRTIDTDSVSDSLDVFSNSEDVKPHNPMFDAFEAIDDDNDDECNGLMLVFELVDDDEVDVMVVLVEKL